MSKLQAIEIFADSARGQYIPQYWAHSVSDPHYGNNWIGFDADDIDILLVGPELEVYWDVWATMLDNATCTINGHEYRLHQDGDLFCVCEELLSDEEYEEFFGKARTD